MKTFIYSIIFVAVFLGVSLYSLKKHDVQECEYWKQAGLNLTPMMESQCIALNIK